MAIENRFPWASWLAERPTVDISGLSSAKAMTEGRRRTNERFWFSAKLLEQLGLVLSLGQNWFGIEMNENNILAFRFQLLRCLQNFNKPTVNSEQRTANSQPETSTNTEWMTDEQIYIRPSNCVVAPRSTCHRVEFYALA